MSIFSKPVIAIAGFGLAGAIGGAESTRMHDDETQFSQGVRGAARSVVGGVEGTVAGAGVMGAARYGTAAYKGGIKAAGRLARMDFHKLLGLFK